MKTSNINKNNYSIKSIVHHLRSLSNLKAIEGMARYGITSNKIFGISVKKLRSIAKEIGKNHAIAQKLWKTEILDARFLAIFIEEPDKVTETQMERWANDFDNWAICDGCCSHLFDKTPFAWKKAVNWALRQIGKLNLAINKKAIQLAKEIHTLDAPSARWIASDALRELTSDALQNRLQKKKC